MISTNNIGKKEIFNAKSASQALQTVSETLTVVGAAIADSTDKENGEISEIGYIFTDTGMVYGTISATVIDVLPDLIDLLNDVGEMKVEVIHRKSNSGRDFISLQILG